MTSVCYWRPNDLYHLYSIKILFCEGPPKGTFVRIQVQHPPLGQSMPHSDLFPFPACLPGSTPMTQWIFLRRGMYQAPDVVVFVLASPGSAWHVQKKRRAGGNDVNLATSWAPWNWDNSFNSPYFPWISWIPWIYESMRKPLGCVWK